MSFSFSEITPDGLILIKPHLFEDRRGIYKKVYEKKAFSAAGIIQEFTETSEILSSKGVLRGLHFQTRDPQAKLLHVIRGAVFDVAIDLRKDSPTFGKYQAYYLTAEENQALFIPEEFAHGFLVLEDDTIFTYQCSGSYQPAFCGGLAWDDPTLNISWPLDKIGGKEHLILSEKDMHNLSFSEYCETYQHGC